MATQEDLEQHLKQFPGTRALTEEEFKKLNPRLQGFASYMQAGWNPSVPENCSYGKGTAEEKSWNEGSFAAMLEVQDGEE